jgi:2,3-bisphosphoglycerate-dependent phosphoglycerate mutase
MTPIPQVLRIPFYFLRHGETELNRLALVAGATDVPLNPTGWVQARAAAARLGNTAITTIYASPMQRARDTAQCVADALDVPLVIVPELHERHWGIFEGQPRALRVRGAKPEGGESPEDFRDRTLRALASIPAAGVPLIVAHSGTFRVVCRALDVPETEAPLENSRPVQFVPGGAGVVLQPL